MKYGDKKLTDLQLQKKIYWLLTEQIIPSQHNFRNNVKEKHEQDRRKIDLLKLYIPGEVWLHARSKLYILLQTAANNSTSIYGMRKDSNTVQELGEALQARYRANIVQKNDRNRYERTKKQGNAQKAGHPEEADLQLQPQRQSTTVGGHACGCRQTVREGIWHNREARQSLQSA
jgi:hypothetical protein